jgi:tetratricopeptide (TPR) repeat protein
MKPIHRIILTLLVSNIVLVFGCASQKAQWPHDTPQPPVSAAGPMESPDYLYKSGMRLIESGDFSQAELFFEEALAADDTHVPSMTGMAEVALANENEKLAFDWAKRAMKNADTDAERSDAITCLMNVYGTTQTNDWLEEMEDLWEDIREVDARPEGAALMMGKAYQETGDYLQAIVCYREVIDWQGAYSADADKAMESLFRQLRAEPGSPVGRSVSRLDKISRGDLCALIIEELKLPVYIDKKTTKKYNARFVTPQQYSENDEEAPLPKDIEGSKYETNIVQVLNYSIRGLEPFPDGSFYPETPVTRSTFALSMEDTLSRIKDEPLLTTAFVGSSSPFPDVPADHFAFNAMVVCTTRNFLAADLDGAFRPDESVTGAEALIGIRRLKEEIKGKQVRY